MQTSELGLRDRKRAQTRARIESAATTLALRDGLEATTIDAISALADISPRTFFNYFESKEDALFGLRDWELSDELIAEHTARADGDPVKLVVGLLVDVMVPSFADPEWHATRIRIMELYPQLVGRIFAHMSQMTGQLSDAVRAVVGEPATEESPWPEVVVSACVAAVRVSVKAWTAAGSTGELDELEARAIALVAEATEKTK